MLTIRITQGEQRTKVYHEDFTVNGISYRTSTEGFCYVREPVGTIQVRVRGVMYERTGVHNDEVVEINIP